MFLPKGYQAVISFQEVCDDNIPIIIPIQIFYTKNSVRLMLWKNRHNGGIFSKKEELQPE